jgi:hypothetical protein
VSTTGDGDGIETGDWVAKGGDASLSGVETLFIFNKLLILAHPPPTVIIPNDITTITKLLIFMSFALQYTICNHIRS